MSKFYLKFYNDPLVGSRAELTTDAVSIAEDGSVSLTDSATLEEFETATKQMISELIALRRLARKKFAAAQQKVEVPVE